MEKDNPVVSETKTIWIHQKLTEQIDKEFDLLGQRMSWLISGNAFLFTAFFVGLNIKTSTTSLLHVTINSTKIPFVVFHPLEKVIALGCIALLGCYICYVSLIAMTAARQVIAEMKKERFKYEIHIQKQLHYTFPITVPYRKAGSHDLGHIMHRNLPRVVASMWFILYSIAVSSILGGDVGFKASILMLFGGLYF